MPAADGAAFPRSALPARLCNLERLLRAMDARGLDGIVATQPLNVFYLSSFNGVAHKADEPRPYAVAIARAAPGHPVMVVADYYLSTFLAQPSWIEDIRPYRAVMMPIDRPAGPGDIDRFIPAHGRGIPWVERARERYGFDMAGVLRKALADIGLAKGRVAFDDMAMGFRLRLDGIEVVDGYDPLMFARAVKTADEHALLVRATEMNEAAIRRTVASWQRGMSWRDLNHAYCRAVTDLGGFVHDPGGMVWGHPRGADAALTLQTGLETDPVEPGSHVMFDCHATLDLYCSDGGKTWIVDGEPKGLGKVAAKGTAAAAEALLAAMRPGARVSQLQTIAREAYRKSGVPNADASVAFFHGLGLSHMDLEQTTADGKPNGDWMLEEGMVAPMHLLYPGGADERFWLEEIVRIEAEGGKPLFSWGFEPLTMG